MLVVVKGDDRAAQYVYPGSEHGRSGQAVNLLPPLFIDRDAYAVSRGHKRVSVILCPTHEGAVIVSSTSYKLPGRPGCVPRVPAQRRYVILPFGSFAVRSQWFGHIERGRSCGGTRPCVGWGLKEIGGG